MSITSFDDITFRYLVEHACKKGSLEDLHTLNKIKLIDISQNDNELLIIAAKKNRRNIIEYIFLHKNFNITNGVTIAFYYNMKHLNSSIDSFLINSDIMDYIKESDKKYKTTFNLAVEYKNYDVLDYVLEQPEFKLKENDVHIIFTQFCDYTIAIKKIINSTQFKLLTETNPAAITYFQEYHNKQNLCTVYETEYPEYLQNIINKKKTDNWIIYGLLFTFYLLTCLK